MRTLSTFSILNGEPLEKVEKEGIKIIAGHGKYAVNDVTRGVINIFKSISTLVRTTIVFP